MNGGVPGFTQFFGSSTAGNGSFITNPASVTFRQSGRLDFYESSTAANGTFINKGGTGPVGSDGGAMRFQGSASAGNGSVTTEGGTVSGAFGGSVFFTDISTGASATLINNGGTVTGANGGRTAFFGSSSAGNAMVIAEDGIGGGGAILFGENSTGGTARVEVFGDGKLDISPHNAPGVSVGSIEGSGLVFLGAFNLTVGSNKLSTNFSGLMQDGGMDGGAGGSLTKVGTGRLVLTKANNYSGGTSINGGKLVVNNKSGSGTGSGPVQVNAGRLGGKGTIAGAVIVGTGSGPGAVLTPGNNATTHGTLTIQSTLTFKSDATYNFSLRSSISAADEVVANGVTINSGAQFTFAGVGATALSTGKVFKVIDNTAATSITGVFSNLADRSTFTSNGSTYQANYEGGDGNDLTLTVVP